MGNYVNRRDWTLRCDRGEVGSWLILAAGLALAAVVAATTMTGVIGTLVTRVADAAEGQAGPGAGGGDDGAASVPSGSGNPTPVDAQAGPGAGGSDGTGDDDETMFPEWCYQSGGNRQCDEDGNCLSFEPLACSTSAMARDAYDWHQWYESCAVAQPSIIRCRDFVPGFDLAFKVLLESEIGAHPGDLFLAAARACDAGHASCELWTRLAHFVFDNREVIATSTVLGDLIPGARGVSCIPSFIDGAITAGEATECAVGLVTGLSVPIPSGVIDDALEGN